MKAKPVRYACPKMHVLWIDGRYSVMGMDARKMQPARDEVPSWASWPAHAYMKFRHGPVGPPMQLAGAQAS